MLLSCQLTHWPLGDLNAIFKNVIFNLALLISIFKSSYDNVLRWMPQELTDDKSTLVQVMAWCCQATSLYLNKCWSRSPTPYGVTRPEWVNVGNTTMELRHPCLWTSNLNNEISYVAYGSIFMIFFISKPSISKCLTVIQKAPPWHVSCMLRFSCPAVFDHRPPGATFTNML